MNNILLEAKNLGLKLGGKIILNEISFSLNKGDFLIVLGANGSGKSSLFKCLNQTYALSGGEVLFEGKSVGSLDSKLRAQQIITITQKINEMLFIDLSVIENFVLYALRYLPANLNSISKADYNECKEYLKSFQAGLADKLDNLVSSLSGGEQQLLALGIALYVAPKLLILDEHTSALDPKAAEEMMTLSVQKVKENSVSCMMISHNLEHLKFANKLLILKKGQVAYFGEANSLTREEIMAMSY